MTPVATQAMQIVYGCGHLASVFVADQIPIACPRCHPAPGGSGYVISATRYEIHEADGSAA